MDDQRLTVFATVAETRSFTEAARRLHVGQSGVSNAVRALEREVGAELFDRGVTPVELTAAGRALLPQARDALESMSRARQAVAEVSGGLTGTLRLGILFGLTPSRVWTALADYRRSYPAVDLRLTGPGAAGSADHLSRLRDGDLDAAIVISSGSVVSVRQHALVSETIVLACTPGHRLAAGPAPALRDLVDEPVIDFPRGWGVRSAVDHAFMGVGVAERRIGVEMNDISTILHLVRLGLGVAFVPASITDTAPDLHYVTIGGSAPGYRVSAAVSTTRDPAPTAVRFLEQLLDPRSSAD